MIHGQNSVCLRKGSIVYASPPAQSDSPFAVLPDNPYFLRSIKRDRAGGGRHVVEGCCVKHDSSSSRSVSVGARFGFVRSSCFGGFSGSTHDSNANPSTITTAVTGLCARRVGDVGWALGLDQQVSVLTHCRCSPLPCWYVVVFFSFRS